MPSIREHAYTAGARKRLLDMRQVSLMGAIEWSLARPARWRGRDAVMDLGLNCMFGEAVGFGLICSVASFYLAISD